MPVTIQDASGVVFRDVEEYDEKTGSVTRYLLDKDGKRIVNEIGRHTTYRSRRPRPLTVLSTGRENPR